MLKLRLDKKLPYTYSYHESFKVETFCGFHTFLHVRETFLYEISRWHCSYVQDLKESTRGSVKVFHKGLRVQLAVTLFCLESFMVYGIVIPLHTANFALTR